jgi:hypothetical protein
MGNGKWEIIGKVMGNYWEINGKWEIIGKLMGNGKLMEN